MRKLSSFGYNDCRCFNFFNYCCNDIVVQYSRDYAVLIIVFFLFSCKNFLAGLKYEGFQENKNISGHQQDFFKSNLEQYLNSLKFSEILKSISSSKGGVLKN